MRRFRGPALLVALLSATLVLAGCGASGGPAAPPKRPRRAHPASSPSPTRPCPPSTTWAAPRSWQSSAAPGSAHREMPVQLNGVIAAPQEGGPYPVAVILHGMHPGCPVDANGVDSWPCDPADEQPNHAGFAWLAEELAARGMVAAGAEPEPRVHPRLRRDHPRRSPRAAGRPAPSGVGRRLRRWRRRLRHRPDRPGRHLPAAPRRALPRRGVRGHAGHRLGGGARRRAALRPGGGAAAAGPGRGVLRP